MAHSALYDSSLPASAQGLAARLRKVWTDYRRYSATLCELHALSDRELADLGIHRAAIDGIARQGVWGA